MSTTLTQTELILNAIESAEKSLVLVKKLLGVEAGRVPQGVTGVFNGEFMITDEGKRYQVPPNYASKSMIVVGDTIKYIPGDDTGVPPQFKQIAKVERIKSRGVLSKKDGRWAIVCEQGSFWVLPAAVKFFAGEIGQEVQVVLPQDFKKLNAQWAALESPPPVSPKQPAAQRPLPEIKEIKGEIKIEEITGTVKPGPGDDEELR